MKGAAADRYERAAIGFVAGFGLTAAVVVSDGGITLLGCLLIVVGGIGGGVAAIAHLDFKDHGRKGSVVVMAVGVAVTLTTIIVPAVVDIADSEDAIADPESGSGSGPGPEGADDADSPSEEDDPPTTIATESTVDVAGPEGDEGAETPTKPLPPTEVDYTSEAARTAQQAAASLGPTAALDVWEEVRSANPNDVEVALGYALALQAHVSTDDYIAHLLAERTQWPAEARWYGLAADGLRAIGNLAPDRIARDDLPTALEILSDGVRVAPENPYLLQELGRLLTYDLDRNDEGLEYLSLAAWTYPLDPASQFFYGYWGLDEVGQTEEGRQVVEHVVTELDPSYSPAWTGLLYFGDDTEDLTTYERALASPARPLTFLDGFAARLAALDEETAGELVEGLILRHPDDPDLLLVSAYHNRDRGRLPTAVNEWRAAVERGGYADDPDFGLRLAYLLDAQGNPDLAMEELRRPEFVNDSGVALERAALHLRAERWTSGWSELERAAELAPDARSKATAWRFVRFFPALDSAKRLEGCASAAELDESFESQSCAFEVLADDGEGVAALQSLDSALPVLTGGLPDRVLSRLPDAIAQLTGFAEIDSWLSRLEREHAADSTVRVAVATTASLDGRIELAADVLNVVDDQVPDAVLADPWLHHLRGRLLDQLERFPAADDEYRQAAVYYAQEYSEHPESFRLLAGQAECFVAAGQWDDGVEAFSTLLDLDEPAATDEDRAHWLRWRSTAHDALGDGASAGDDRREADRLDPSGDD